MFETSGVHKAKSDTPALKICDVRGLNVAVYTPYAWLYLSSALTLGLAYLLYFHMITD